MANEVQADHCGPLHERPAGADLTGKEGYAVVIDSSSTLQLAGAGVRAHGILKRGGASGVSCTYAVFNGDWHMVVLGGTVVAGDLLVVDSAGKFVLSTTGELGMGCAIEGGASGEMVTVQAEYLGPVV